MAGHTTGVDESWANLADVLGEDRVAIFGVDATIEVGVMQSATDREGMTARVRDVPGHLLEPVVGLVGVLIRKRGLTSKPGMLRKREGIEGRRRLLLGRARFLLRLGVPRDDPLAHHVEHRRPVVVQAAVPRRCEELAEFDLHPIPDRKRGLFGPLVLNLRGVAIFSLAGIPLGRPT